MSRRPVAAVLAAAVLSAGPVAAEPILRPGQSVAIQSTSSGELIVAPPGPEKVIASIVEIPAGSSTPEHQHPYPRFGYVLSGRLEVENLDTGQKSVLETGDFTADPTGQWHLGRALGGKPVRLLVIDQVPPDETSNTVQRADSRQMPKR